MLEDVDEHGRTALIIAAMNKSHAILKLLLERNANVNFYDREKMSSLIWSANRGALLRSCSES